MFIKEITTELINGGEPVVTPIIADMTKYEVYTYFRANKRSVNFNLDVRGKTVAELIAIGAVTDYTGGEIGAPVGYFPKRADSNTDFLVNIFTYITPDLNTNIEFKLHLFNNENSGPNLAEDAYTMVIDDSELYVRLNAPTQAQALTVFGTQYTGPVEKFEYAAQFAASGESGKVAINGASLSVIDNSGAILYKLPTGTGNSGQILQINSDKTCSWVDNVLTYKYLGANFSALFRKTSDLIEVFVYKVGTIIFGEQMQILIPETMNPTCNTFYIINTVSYIDFSVEYSVVLQESQYYVQIIVINGGITENSNDQFDLSDRVVAFTFQYY